MQIGIIPSDRQNAMLLKEIEDRLRQILKASKNLDRKEETLLHTTLDHLSKDGLLNEQLLLEGSRNQLLDMLKDALI